MKKLICIIFSVVILTTLCGCKYNPKIRIINTIWNADNTTIPVGDKYVLDFSHPYDQASTDKGIDITIHFNEKWEATNGHD